MQILGSAELGDNGLGSRFFRKKCICQSEAGGFGHAPTRKKSAMAIAYLVEKLENMVWPPL